MRSSGTRWPAWTRRPWSPPAVARRPCRRGRRSGSSAPRGRRRNAGAPFPRRSRRCPARCPGCRCRSTNRRSSGRTSSGPCDRVRGNAPSWPMRHQVGVGDQHTRRVLVGAEHANGLAGLHQQRFVVLEFASAFRRSCQSTPSCAPLADTAVDNQVLRPLRHLRVEVVHQHAQRRLGQPAFGAQFDTGWRLVSFCSFLQVLQLHDVGGIDRSVPGGV